MGGPGSLIKVSVTKGYKERQLIAHALELVEEGEERIVEEENNEEHEEEEVVIEEDEDNDEEVEVENEHL